MMLVHVTGSVWSLEQPHSSLINLHVRFQEMLRAYLPMNIPATRCALEPCMIGVLVSEAPYSCSTDSMHVATKTYKQAFWMGKWGHMMPKRTILWSNDPGIRCADRGSLKKSEKKPGNHSGVVKYRNKKGKLCCHATPKLKDSQNLDCNSWFSAVTIYKPSLASNAN